MNTQEKIYDDLHEYLKTQLNDSSLIGIWNEYCQENSYHDDEIFTNDEYFFESYFGTNVFKAVQATQFGEYNYNEEYVIFDGYGNLDTSNEPHSFIDFNMLTDWIIQEEKYDEVDFDIDEYEDEEE